MAIARSIQLQNAQGFVHEFWKCHNSSMYLSSARMKHLLLKAIHFALKHKSFSRDSVKIHAVCFMDNHCHKLIHYENGTKQLSLFMKLAHGYFAQKFNFLNKSKGAVNNGRPKTIPIENEAIHLMRTHFYIESNPIRVSGSTWGQENLKNYYFNSYRLFAYGIVDAFTEIISIPLWYLRLGRTPHERQIRYRKLFRNYLNKATHSEHRKKLNGNYLFTRAIGSQTWIKQIKSKIAFRINELKMKKCEPNLSDHQSEIRSREPTSDQNLNSNPEANPETLKLACH